MGRLKKITVQVPEELLTRAREQGEGITETIRGALELKARRQAYQQLRELRGKIKWSISLREMRGK
jgi:hypothetical protein